jgi:hypothetical protein
MRIFEKIKSIGLMVIHDWQKSPQRNKRIFLVLLAGIMLLFVLVTGMVTSGTAQSLLKDSFFTSNAMLSIPSSETAGKSVLGNHVVFNDSLGGNSCYQIASPQTFCFKAETYTSNAEHVLGLSLMFPEGWIVTDVRVAGRPNCDSGSLGSLKWALGDSLNEVDIFHQRNQNMVDHCVATYCVDVTAGKAQGQVNVDWKFESENFGNAAQETCSLDGVYTCAWQTQPAAEIPPCD